MVGIAAERGFGLIVGLYGILRAGAAYLPLDPDMPSARLLMMIEDGGAEVILTQRGVQEGLAGAAGVD